MSSHAPLVPDGFFDIGSWQGMSTLFLSHGLERHRLCRPVLARGSDPARGGLVWVCRARGEIVPPSFVKFSNFENGQKEGYRTVVLPSLQLYTTDAVNHTLT